MSADKDAWRARLLAARRARSTADRDAQRASICRHVLARVATTGTRCVAAYEPLPSEPGSRSLLRGLAELGARVVVPVTLADRDLDWRVWTDGGAHGGAHGGADGELLGVDAMADVDLALVPALAVAVDGVRLGRGGGSYDRALRRLRLGAPAVALLFADELVEALPRDEWDVPVSAVVTPAGWVDVGGGRRGAGGLGPE